MKYIYLPLLVLALLVAGGCNRDPKVVSKRYVDSGNKYFDKQKFKEASLMYRQAISKDRRNGEAYYRLGMTEMKLGQVTGAYRSFLRAVELKPDSIEAKVKLADLSLYGYMSSPRKDKQLLDEAKKQDTEILKADPRSYDGLRIKGYLSMLSGSIEDALASFAQAQQVKPYQPDVVLTYVQLLAREDRFAEAEKLARESINHDKSYGQMYDVLFMQFLRLKRPDDAEAILKLKVDNNPKDVRYRMQLATYYYSQQKKQEMDGVLSFVVGHRQEFPFGLREVGDFYYRLGQLDRATEYYDRGVREDSARKTEYQKRMVEMLVQQGKNAEASQLVETVLKSDPKDMEAVSMRAALVLEGGSRAQVDKAIVDLQTVLSSTPQNPVVRYQLGRAYLAKNDIEQAKLQFQESIKVRPDYLPARVQLGMLLLIKRDFTAALNLANETLQTYPNSLSARLIRTSALAELGDNVQTRKELGALVQAFPKSRDAQVQLGILNLQEKKFKDAEEIFTRLRANAPADPRGTFYLAQAYMAQNRAQDAIGLLQGELQKNPDRQDIRATLADVALRSANYPLAIQELNTLIQKNPNSAPLQSRLGEVYRQTGDYKTALACFKKARDLAPADAGANLSFAMMLEATGQGASAKPIYEQLVKLDPENAVALNNLAFMMADSGQDLDQALTLAQKAKQKLPNDANVSDTLGWIYIKKNLSDNAIRVFRELVQKNPTHVTWRFHLAMALYQKGDRAGARKELETCLKNKPTRDEESKIRDLMAKVG